MFAALFNVAVFLLIDRLFGTAIGFVSAIVLTLMPARIIGAIYLGSYEFAMIFFILALWLYLGSKKGPFGAGLLRMAFAGVFFALAALARNAFVISFVPFALYDFYKNRSYKRSLIFAIPFVVIFVSTLTPYSWLRVSNGYLSGFDSQPFSQVGHVFNDPYSAYYNRETIIEEIKNSRDFDRLETHFFEQWGYDVSLSEKIGAYKDSAIFYAVEFFSLTNLGGPLIILLMLAGAYWLYKNRRDILGFFVVWLSIWFLGLVYFETANWNHFLEISFVLVALVGLGVHQLLESLGLDSFKKTIAGLIVLLFLVGHLGYADRWRLYDTYRSSYMGAILELTEKLETIEDTGVVAVDIHPSFAYGLYYFSNEDIIYFNHKTVQDLITEGRLKAAFDIYEVQITVGFSEDLSSNIEKTTGLKTIHWDRTNTR